MAITLERETELDCIAAALDDAADGRGSVLVIEGAAGIGKTRLVEDARALAKLRGFGRRLADRLRAPDRRARVGRALQPRHRPGSLRDPEDRREPSRRVYTKLGIKRRRELAAALTWTRAAHQADAE